MEEMEKDEWLQEQEETVEIEETVETIETEEIAENAPAEDWKAAVRAMKKEEPEEKTYSWGKVILHSLSYVVIAALASALTLLLFMPPQTQTQRQYSKLEELKAVISQCYIGEADEKEMEDMAAAAMVDAIGDQWSFYIPATNVQSLMEQKDNAYVGIGVAITILANDQGFEVTGIEPNSPAQSGGVQVGDVIVAVDGVRVTEVGAATAQNMVGGQEGTAVTITVLRDGKELELALTRRRIVQVVATGRMLPDNIGYIRIHNFNSRSAQETIALFEQLESQGAKAMIFDVRFNPGGYKREMVKLLDYLLPEGVLFRSEDYRGVTMEDKSDKACKNMPMAVLINGESYSAAEFFAAALVEYDYAFTVGQPTTGKGYFQNVIDLSDGSAVNLSTGKYFTPNGVSLAEVGGLVPDVPVDIPLEVMVEIYTGDLPDEEDEQLQAAIRQLTIGER